MDLTNRVSIITGSASGIGAACARAFAARGAKVVVNDFGGARDGTGGSSQAAEGVAQEIRDAGGEAIASTGPASSGPVVEPVAALLASADLAKGEKVGKKCVACHTFNEGGANKVGPGLYGIVDRPMASVDGFGYSSALTAYADGKSWTYAELNGFLFKPKAHVKGTSMGFAGIKKTADRAAMIAYLRTLAGTPAPLPASPEPEAPAAEGTEQEG